MAEPRDARATGHMLQLVRVARGLTQAQLSETSGVSQALLSKAESGVVELDPTRLATVAGALGVPVARLTSGEPTDAVLSACAFHRKRSSLSVSDAKRIRAVLDLRRMQVERLVGGGEDVTLPRKAPTDDDWDSPESIALEVREAMGLGAEPVANLVEAVEGVGAVVVVTDMNAARIDAIGNWPQGHRPLFMLNQASPADRRRFSLAHEVGHAVMHQVPRSDMETEADRFASELLMPSRAIRADMSQLDLSSLVVLKSKWGASMSALVRKARDIAVIGDYDYKRLNIALSTAGYRTREPVELRNEEPSLISRAVHLRLRTEPVQQLADEALMTTAEFATIYLEGSDER